MLQRICLHNVANKSITTCASWLMCFILSVLLGCNKMAYCQGVGWNSCWVLKRVKWQSNHFHTCVLPYLLLCQSKKKDSGCWALWLGISQSCEGAGNGSIMILGSGKLPLLPCLLLCYACPIWLIHRFCGDWSGQVHPSVDVVLVLSASR